MQNLALQHFLKPALVNMDTLTPKGSGLTLDPPKNSIGPGTELTVVIRGLDPLDGSTFMIQVVDIMVNMANEIFNVVSIRMMILYTGPRQER